MVKAQVQKDCARTKKNPANQAEPEVKEVRQNPPIKQNQKLKKLDKGERELEARHQDCESGRAGRAEG